MAKYAVTLPAQTAAGADSTTAFSTAVETTDDIDNTLVRAVVVPPAGYSTVTGTVGPNNAQITIRQLRGGSVVQANVAQLVLAVGVNLVAETPVVIAITGGATFAQDDMLDVVMHQNGTGLAIGAGLSIEAELSGR